MALCPGDRFHGHFYRVFATPFEGYLDYVAISTTAPGFLGCACLRCGEEDVLGAGETPEGFIQRHECCSMRDRVPERADIEGSVPFEFRRKR